LLQPQALQATHTPKPINVADGIAVRAQHAKVGHLLDAPQTRQVVKGNVQSAQRSGQLPPQHANFGQTLLLRDQVKAMLCFRMLDRERAALSHALRISSGILEKLLCQLRVQHLTATTHLRNFSAGRIQ
jgi:hypothetical protein